MYKINKVHGLTQIIKMIEGKPYIPNKGNKNKWEWVETIIDPKRLKRFKELNDAEIISKLNF